MYIEEMARASQREGASPVVWAPDYGRCSGDTVPFPVKRVRMRGKQDWICRWKMGRAFAMNFPERRLQGTVVLAEPGPIRWWMYGNLTRPPRPDRLVLIFHGTELKHLPLLPHRRFLLQRLLQKAACIGVVSHEVGNMLLSQFPNVRDKMVRVPGAVRSAWSGQPPSGYEDRRRELIHVGRIHPRKGQLELVQAAGMLPRYLRDEYVLRLIGPVARPEYAREIRKMSRSNGVRLEINGVLNETDLIRAYRRASLLVMPSQRHKSSVEGLGMVMLEAQHFGCPVVGTDIGGIRETMIPGETGLLVPAGDTAALADAVRQLLEDPARAGALAKKGPVFVRDNFSWTRNVHQLGLV